MSDYIRQHQKQYIRPLSAAENALNEASQGKIPSAAYPAMRAAGNVLRAVNPKVAPPSGVQGSFRQSGSHGGGG